MDHGGIFRKNTGLDISLKLPAANIMDRLRVFTRGQQYNEHVLQVPTNHWVYTVVPVSDFPLRHTSWNGEASRSVDDSS